MSDTATTTLTPKQTDREQAISYLKKSLQPGTIVYVIMRHVGKTGMTRYIDLFCIRENRPFRITWNAGLALDIRYDRRHDALRIGGCGFCPAHQTVYDLARTLFGDANALSYSWL